MTREIRALEEERRRIIGRYAAEEMAGEAYITANRALDRDLERLTREKAELVAALRSPLHEDFVDASIRQFCASANARFQARGLRRKAAVSRGSRRKGDLQPLPGHDRGLGPGTIGIGGNQAAVSDRGRD